MKTLSALTAFFLLTLGLVGNINAFRHAFARAETTLSAPGLQGFVACTLQVGCLETYTQALNGPFPKLPTILVVVGISMLALTFRHRRTQTYTASFSLRHQLKDVTLPRWLKHRKLPYSLLVGFYVPLPETGPKRRQVLEGTFRADKSLLAISPGYGKRPELGHMAVFGSARSGKTLHLMAQLCTWGGSVITLDIKGELFRQTGGLRARKGRVFVLSPTGKGHRFDALSAIIASHNGYATAAQIIAAPHLDKEPAFAQRASSGIEAALRAAVLANTAPLTFIRQLIAKGGVTAFVHGILNVLNRFDTNKSEDELTSEEKNADEAHVALHIFLGMAAGDDYNLEHIMSDRYLTSSWGSMEQRLKPFVQEGVRHLLGGSDFSPKELMQSPCTVYLDFPEESLEATSPVYNLIVTGLKCGMTKYVDEERAGKRPPVPVLIALDECARAPLQDLNNILATVASRNISVLLYLQSPSQFDAIYKKDVTDAILNNCSTQLYFWSASLSTAEHISSRCHKVSVTTQAQSKRRGFWNRPTNTTSSTAREVITIDEIMLLGGAERQLCIAMMSGKPPTLVKRINYYEHPALNVRLQTPPPDLRRILPAREQRAPQATLGAVQEAKPIAPAPMQPSANQQGSLFDKTKQPKSKGTPTLLYDKREPN